jgi:hypothetical protein
MPRYTRKISLATAVGPQPEASIKTTDWKRIARVYGNVLPRSAQQAVLEVSNRYLRLAMFEPTAESVGHAEKRLKEITRGAHQLMDGLSKCGGASAAAMHATRAHRATFEECLAAKG